MIRLTQITPEQLEWYREVTGGHYGMDFGFGGPSGYFGFHGEFDISSEGQVYLGKPPGRQFPVSTNRVR